MNTMIPLAAGQLAALAFSSTPQTLGESDRHRLRSAPLLGHMDETAFSHLAQQARLICVGWDATLYERGDKVEGLYVLLEGEVRLTGEGNVLFDVVLPVQSFGEPVMLGTQPSPFTARVCRGAHLAWLPKAAIEAAMAEDSGFVLRILDRLASWCQSHIQEIHELRCLNPGERLARYLLSQRQESPSGILRLPTSKKVLAQRLGMTPESLARALTRLAAHGVARGTDDAIRITDEAALRRFAKLPGHADQAWAA
jgi:CRP-like cAMP-binding protein